MCDIMQKYMEKSRAEGVEKGISKTAENLRGYGLTEAQIEEIVRKSREGAEAEAKHAN